MLSAHVTIYNQFTIAQRFTEYTFYNILIYIILGIYVWCDKHQVNLPTIVQMSIICYTTDSEENIQIDGLLVTGTGR